jgi:hypothetical protein
MKKSSMISSLFLLLAALTLSGCIFPYWGDEGRGYRGGHDHYDGGDRGHHEGGGRR